MRHRLASHTTSRGGVHEVVIVGLALVGVVFLLYPVVSTVWNNHQTARVIEQYRSIAEDQPEDVVNQELERARAFNEESARGPIFDPWLDRFTPETTEYSRYLNQLASNQAMGRLIVPDIDVDLPIYHGTSSATLNKGLGHMFGSHLPIGGEGTHAMITGHTGLPNATMFDNLTELAEGDVFYLQAAGQKLKYEVDRIDVVLPHEVDALRADDPRGDYVTLITCTPYGINTHRLLVRGHAVPLGEGEERIFDDAHGSGWTWWMTLLTLLALLALAAMAWWVWKQKTLKKLKIKWVQRWRRPKHREHK